MDIPSDPMRRELFEESVANGRLVVLSDEVEAPKAKPQRSNPLPVTPPTEG